ncbi:MAG: hypothetical protein B6242_14165 [Anaerolineaceae bacterium 4572_78]|nr:MAG: hypothetical protein B6242_14165 [Anaerolineaceae bacterium 4572_78]
MKLYHPIYQEGRTVKNLLSRSLLFGLLMLLQITSAQAADMVIGNYELVGQQRLSFTEFQYTYTGHITNNGGDDLKNVTATVSTTSANITIVDDSLSFGDVLAGSTVKSTDTFVIKSDRTVETLNLADLVWSVQSSDVIMVEPIIIKVTDVTPLTSEINQLVTFSVSGTNLPDDMGFTVGDCTPSSYELTGRSETPTIQRFFQCTQQGEPGIKRALVKDVPGGDILYEFEVQANVSPDANANTSVLNQDFSLHIPHLVYKGHSGNEQHFWANLQLIPSDGTTLLFKLEEAAEYSGTVPFSAEGVIVTSDFRILIPRLIAKSDSGESLWWAIFVGSVVDGNLVFEVSKYGAIRNPNDTFDLIDIASQNTGIVGPSGGIISDDLAEVLVQVPEGSVTDETSITITRGRTPEGNASIVIESDRDTGLVDIILPPPEILDSNIPSASVQPKSLRKIETTCAKHNNTCIIDEGLIGGLYYPIKYRSNKPTGKGWYLKLAHFWETASETYGFGSRLAYGIDKITKNATTEKVEVTITATSAAMLTSACNYNQKSCYEGKKPVLFVHGYIPTSQGYNGLGGGKDTWGNFPHLINELGYVPFEFRWVTSARFQDAATDLGRAIKQIVEKTGYQVHIIAHSFGGVLTRTYLQSLISHEPYLKGSVASVTTVGTPHSGIPDSNKWMHDQYFLSGQDNQIDHEAFLESSLYPPGLYPFRFVNLLISCAGEIIGGDGQIDFCEQISCYQMGEYVNFNSEEKELLGINKSPGKLITDLSDIRSYPLPEDLPILVLIGLTTTRGYNSVLDDGDGLISFYGQRFLPGSGLNAPLLNNFQPKKDGIVRGIVNEFVLGVGRSKGPDDEHYISKEDFDYFGYKHSTCPVGPSDAHPMVYIKCTDVDNCEHDTFKLVKSRLKSHQSELYECQENCEEVRFPATVTVKSAYEDKSISSARVSFEYKKDGIPHDAGSATTDENGVAKANLVFKPKTVYEVKVIADDYRGISYSFETDATIEASKHSKFVQLTPKRDQSKGDLTVFVSAADKRDIEVDYTLKLLKNGITIRSSDYDRYPFYNTTPYTLEALPVGTYELQLVANGYRRWKGEVEIRPAYTVEKSIVLQPLATNYSPVVEQLTAKAACNNSLKGSFKVSDEDGNQVTKLRVHFSNSPDYPIDSTETCFLHKIACGDSFDEVVYHDELEVGEHGKNCTFVIEGGQCQKLLKQGKTIHYKVQARDIHGAKAKVVENSLIYKQNVPPTIKLLEVYANDPQNVWGEFLIDDPENDNITKLRVHFSDSSHFPVEPEKSCYTETIEGVSFFEDKVEPGYKQFKMPSTEICKALIEKGKMYLFLKIEGRDICGQKAAVTTYNVSRNIDVAPAPPPSIISGGDGGSALPGTSISTSNSTGGLEISSNGGGGGRD